MNEQISMQFPTGSRYEGSYNHALCCMDGYGSYTFRDGSKYIGYFKAGKFHGPGQLRMMPSQFLYKGYFENGKLVEIEDMQFEDGLQFVAKIDGLTVNTDKWYYCIGDDRRYEIELRNGINIGPDSYLTQEQPTRPLRPGTYDTGEGIFDTKTHFVAQKEGLRFVACSDEVKHIMENCRKSGTVADLKPMEIHSILSRNIAENGNLIKHRRHCDCKGIQKMQKKMLRNKMKNMKLTLSENDSSCRPISVSSCSKASFRESIKENETEIFEELDKTSLENESLA